MAEEERKATEAAGFDAFLTTERNIRYLNVGILDRAEGGAIVFLLGACLSKTNTLLVDRLRRRKT